MKYGFGYALFATFTALLSRTILYFRKNEIDYVLNIIKNDGSKILDFGCNTGWYTKIIKKRNSKCKVYGADINKFAIKYASLKYKDVKFFYIDKNFYQNKRFDIIILSHILEHVKNPNELIRNIINLLNKKGKLIIVIPQDRIRGDSAIFHFLFNLICLKFENPHVIKLKYKDCKNILTKSGLTITDYIYINYFPPFKTNTKKFYTWSLVITATKTN